MVKVTSFGPFVKGVDASAGVVSQPKGTLPRASNLLLTKRGSLKTCDGSAILHQFGSGPAAGRGASLALFYFAPTGVPSYYLLLAYALDQHLGPPQNLTVADAGAGGTLTINVTHYYSVTALDGAGGETTVSNVVSFVMGGASHKVTLTWNIVPNAASYNVYHSLIPSAQGLYLTSSLPVLQPPFATLTASFTDDGSPLTQANLATAPTGVVKISAAGVSPAVVQMTTTVPFFVTVGPGLFGTTGITNVTFNVVYTVSGIISSTVFLVTTSDAGVVALAKGTTSGSGAITGPLNPGSDTSQQIALFKIPVIAGSPALLPVSYNNSNIVALFPANPLAATSVGSGGGGGGGGSGGGGGTGGGGGGGHRGFQ